MITGLTIEQAKSMLQKNPNGFVRHFAHGLEYNDSFIMINRSGKFMTWDIHDQEINGWDWDITGYDDEILIGWVYYPVDGRINTETWDRIRDTSVFPYEIDLEFETMAA